MSTRDPEKTDARAAAVAQEIETNARYGVRNFLNGDSVTARCNVREQCAQLGVLGMVALPKRQRQMRTQMGKVAA